MNVATVIGFAVSLHEINRKASSQYEALERRFLEVIDRQTALKQNGAQNAAILADLLQQLHHQYSTLHDTYLSAANAPLYAAQAVLYDAEHHADFQHRDMQQELVQLRTAVARLEFETHLVATSPTSIDVDAIDMGGFGDTSGKQLSHCTDASGHTLVLVVLGQSNAGNSGARLYSASHDVDNFNPLDGRCYHASDPLLGPTDNGGNFATRLGDILIERHAADHVVIADIASGGSFIEQWADDGPSNDRILYLIRRLYDAKLTPDAILWHQGEAEGGLQAIKIRDPGGRVYRKNLREVVATFRRYEVAAPFFVALASHCGKVPEGTTLSDVRAGQASAVDPALGIYQGPDTDVIRDADRVDSCHMSAGGQLLHATAWADILVPALARGQSGAADRSARVR